MTRSAAVTVRRPGLSRAPATSTRTWSQVAPVKQRTNGHIQSAKLRGTLPTMIRGPVPPVEPGPAQEITVMTLRTDTLHDRIAAYPFPRGGVDVMRANRGYTLYSRRTEGP